MKKQYFFGQLLIIGIAIFVFSCSKKDKFVQPPPVNHTGNIKHKGADNYKINMNDAVIYAENFIYTHFENQHTAIKKVDTFKKPIPDRILYLIQLEPSGYILLSDDKRDIPVLAFSETNDMRYNSLDDLPNGPKQWISETLLLNHELEKNQQSVVDNHILDEWNLYLSDTITGNKMPPPEDWDCHEYFTGHVYHEYNQARLSTSWGQGPPYNLYTPICHHGENAGEHKPTGCVATAMAQIMKFWEYPSDFNWGILHNSYSEYDTSSSAYEVANLMIDIGNAIHTIYSCNGSSASNYFAKVAFKNRYNYSNDIIKDNYSYQDVENELRWGRPVMLGGYATEHHWCGITWYTDGHSWVADGFREDYDQYVRECEIGEPYGTTTETFNRNYRYWMHMNWGWRGNANGWYFSNELTHPHGSEDFKWRKDMIIKIHP